MHAHPHLRVRFLLLLTARHASASLPSSTPRHLSSSLKTASSSATIPSDVRLFAERLYALPTVPKLVVYITGGGAQIAPWLLAVPGASRAVLELQVPYSQTSLTQLLGAEPRKFCCAEVAKDLASAAYSRARELSGKREHCIGLGCTAALGSDRPRRGEHRCFIAVRTSGGLHSAEVTLTKGQRDRWLEDAVVARSALYLLGLACEPGHAHSADSHESCQLIPTDLSRDHAARGNGTAQCESGVIGKELLRLSFKSLL